MELVKVGAHLAIFREFAYALYEGLVLLVLILALLLLDEVSENC